MLAGLSLNLLDLFPAASTVSRAPVSLSSSSLAVVGPIPSSSLLHLALNHLHAGEDDGTEEAPAPVLSAKARGKQRAVEDDAPQSEDNAEDTDEFYSLPRRRQRRVMVLTSDEGALRAELAKEGDVSLFGSRRDSQTARLLDLIDIGYLPTSAHLSYFLSTVYLFPGPHAPEAQAAYIETGAKSLVDPSGLSYEPTLVILHSPSDYLEEQINEGAGVEAYASILAHFVSTFSHLCSPPPSLVLFDPFAAEASLPLLPSHLRSKSKTKKRSRDEGGAAPEDDDERDRLPLRNLAERFFDYVGEVEKLHLDLDAPSRLDEPRRFLLSCEASPMARIRLPQSQHRLGVEFALHRVGEDDPEGEDEGGMRIEVVGS
ncbi:hypothetical protein JCM10449v2_000852 [Rhodotorula kratochvilovae]